MRYVPLAPEDKRRMLETIGVPDVGGLFEDIPQELRLRRPLALPPAMAEPEVIRYFQNLADRNASADKYPCFLGAGAYRHFAPSIVDAAISRAEFYTAYTPYQPEISQGTLQAIFEYQTLICQLTGMEVANASLYDGASALAEAVLTAVRLTRRRRILVPATLHPAYRSVVDTYLAHTEIEVLSAPFDSAGRFDESFLATQVDDSLAAVVVQSPNFFGIVEDVEETAQTVKKKGALTIAVVVEAVSLGLLKPPGEVGADIVVGEGQSFGLPLDFGGPYLGFFAISDAHKRQMPGRVVGQTVDRQGRRGFVLTLSTREQHIRREKATSNICTNQGLCALMAAVYLCALGRRGLREVAEQNLKKAFFLRRLLADRLVFSGPVFNEFVVRCGRDATLVNQRLFGEGIVGGLPLGRYFADRSDQMLICVTEQTSRADMERFARLLLE